MNVAYIGNFEPEHSTENHVARALRNTGRVVEQVQEHQPEEWNRLVAMLNGGNGINMVLWTRTIWDPPIPYDLMRSMQQAAWNRGIPTVSFHLDRWWGLNREYEVRESPFFKNSLVITADGGHDGPFAEAGVNHYWMPPGVSRDECLRTTRDTQEFKHDVVFCGSWNGYHDEWRYRGDLIRWLQSKFGGRLGLYPLPNEHSLRGQALVDLYGNAKVMVGDSCLSGGATRYWSDRIPETLGRGGFLIHPEVEGLEDHFTPGEHLVTYPLGDFDRLRDLIEQYVDDTESRTGIAKAGRDHVLQHHTYERRMDQLVELLQDREML